MNKIYRADTRHVTVQEAKELIGNALPKGDQGGAMVSFDSDSEGNIVGEMSIRTGDDDDANPYIVFLQIEFPSICTNLGIVPFLKYRPALEATYSGDPEFDSEYAIRYDDLVRLANLYGIEVVIGQPSPAGPAPQAQEPSEPAPMQAAAMPLWGLKPRDQMQRRGGLRDALYVFLSRADKTKPLPTVGQVLEEWRIRRPGGVVRVHAASVDFETERGEEKECSLASLKERIRNMTTVLS